MLTAKDSRIGKRFLCCLALVLPMAMPAFAEETLTRTIQDNARVLDADVIIVGKQRVILWGVDAPERGQTCVLSGKPWGCYDAAKRKLELLAGRGEVTCMLLGEPDPFNRYFGVCESGGEDINAEMVRSGMALAYLDQTDDYEAVQIGRAHV